MGIQLYLVLVRIKVYVVCYEEENVYLKDLKIVFTQFFFRLYVKWLVKPYYLSFSISFNFIYVCAAAIDFRMFLGEFVPVTRIFQCFLVRGYCFLKFFSLKDKVDNLDSMESGICRMALSGLFETLCMFLISMLGFV